MAGEWRDIVGADLRVCPAEPGQPHRVAPTGAPTVGDYYEHIIRNDEELQRICQYLLDNPARWAEDWENPDVITVAK